MLRDYLSADTFKRGIVQYLQKYSYKNTKNEDLWNSMMHVSGTQKLCIWGWLADCIVLFCPVLWYSIPMNQSTFQRNESDLLFLVLDLPHRWHTNNGWLLLQKPTLIINLSKSLSLSLSTHACPPYSFSGISAKFLRFSVKSLSSQGGLHSN